MTLLYANGFDALTGLATTQLRTYLQAEGWFFQQIDHFGLTAGVYGGSAMYVGGAAGIGPYQNRRPFEKGAISEDSVILAARITHPGGDPGESSKLCLYRDLTPVIYIDFATTGRIRCVCNGVTSYSRTGVVNSGGVVMASLEYRFSDGYFKVIVGGDTVIEVATSTVGLNTYVDGWGMQTYWTWAAMVVDDVYCLQTDDVAPNSVLGNVRVRSHLVVANGDVIQLDPVNAATNYQAVQSPDLSKTSYVTTSVVGEYDLYQMADGSVSRIIYGVSARVGAWQGDATQLRVSAILKTEATEYENDSIATQSNRRVYAFNWGNNPYTGVAWTNEEINAVQVGGKLASVA